MDEVNVYAFDVCLEVVPGTDLFLHFVPVVAGLPVLFQATCPIQWGAVVIVVGGVRDDGVLWEARVFELSEQPVHLLLRHGRVERLDFCVNCHFPISGKVDEFYSSLSGGPRI